MRRCEQWFPKRFTVPICSAGMHVISLWKFVIMNNAEEDERGGRLFCSPVGAPKSVKKPCFARMTGLDPDLKEGISALKYGGKERINSVSAWVDR